MPAHLAADKADWRQNDGRPPVRGVWQGRRSVRTAPLTLVENRLCIGDLQIDFADHTAARSGPVSFTPLEWHILELLAESPGKPVSSSHILILVWGAPYQRDEVYLATYIWRLRQKIEPDPAHPMFLRTVPGLGYQLDAALASPSDCSQRQ